MTKEATIWTPTPSALGKRAVQIALAQLALKVKAPLVGPNSSAQIRSYFAGCVRGGDAIGAPDQKGSAVNLRLTQGNWCAAFASWCMAQALAGGGEQPHGYRAGVVEIVEDAQKLKRWAPLELVKKGGFVPAEGDLAIWDRSEPGKPETSWYRHVNRVVHYDPKGAGIADDLFLTIGGNEGRTIGYTPNRPKGLLGGKLLGFVSYQDRLIG